MFPVAGAPLDERILESRAAPLPPPEESPAEEVELEVLLEEDEGSQAPIPARPPSPEPGRRPTPGEQEAATIIGTSVLPYTIDDRGRAQLLLGLESRRPPWRRRANQWTGFGGALRTTESIEVAAAREFFEETAGLAIAIAQCPTFQDFARKLRRQEYAARFDEFVLERNSKWTCYVLFLIYVPWTAATYATRVFNVAAEVTREIAELTSNLKHARVVLNGTWPLPNDVCRVEGTIGTVQNDLEIALDPPTDIPSRMIARFTINPIDKHADSSPSTEVSEVARLRRTIAQFSRSTVRILRERWSRGDSHEPRRYVPTAPVDGLNAGELRWECEERRRAVLEVELHPKDAIFVWMYQRAHFAYTRIVDLLRRVPEETRQFVRCEFSEDGVLVSAVVDYSILEKQRLELWQPTAIRRTLHFDRMSHRRRLIPKCFGKLLLRILEHIEPDRELQRHWCVGSDCACNSQAREQQHGVRQVLGFHREIFRGEHHRPQAPRDSVQPKRPRARAPPQPRRPSARGLEQPGPAP